MTERQDQRRARATTPSPPATPGPRTVAEFRREYERQFPGLLEAMG